MPRRLLTSSLASIALLSFFVTTATHAAGAAGLDVQEVNVKSLAGPPSEFAENRLPDAQEAVTKSNLLLLDRRTSSLPTKKASQEAPPIETFEALEGVGFSLVQASSLYPYFSPSVLTAPDGSQYTFDGASTITCSGGPCGEYQAAILIEEFEESDGGISVFSISPGEVENNGAWTLAMSPPVSPSRTTVEVDSMLSFEEEGISVVILEECPSGNVCQEKSSYLSFLENSAPSLGLSYRKATDGTVEDERPVVLDELALEITEIGSRRVVHRDDVGASRAKNLGIDSFGRSILPLPTLPIGEYGIRLDFTGRVEGVGKIRRTAFYHLPIIEKSLRLNGRVEAEVVDDRRLRLDVGMDPLTSDFRHVFAYAEVWSHDESRPIAWISGMTYPRVDEAGRSSLPMMLDARWIALAGVSGHQYSLRNLRIQDSRTFLPIALEQEMVFTVEKLPAAATLKALDVSRDASLYQGAGDVRIPIAVPAAVQGAGGGVSSAAKSSDPTGVLLVHGWCSGPNWHSSDFPGHTPDLIGGTAEFVDSFQSRSHDGFAQLIQAQGDQAITDAFSIVAHSQGGAAALHLLTFYNSGLDHSTAPRKIQTVGTPYGGSTLMNLYLGTGPLGLLIAEIFGFCTPQFDLSTLGSSLWLSTIPVSMRYQVFYYRSHYERPDTFWEKLQFWRWRCNFASFVIPGVDDGVVSNAQSKLPQGFFDQGKTEGECHTGGMKHPDQKDNSSRNAVMNQLARPLPGSTDFSADLICTPQANATYPYWDMHCNANVANGTPPFLYRWRYDNGGWFTGSSSRSFECLNLSDPISLQVFDAEGEQTEIDTDYCPPAIP